MKTGKLDKPPYAHNWVRYIFPDQKRTTKELVHFAKGFPTTTYTAAGPIIRDRIMYSLERKTALIAAATKGRANSRPIVKDYVSSFYDYDEIRCYSGNPYFDEIIEPFRITKDIFVPVKPLITIIEKGKLLPIFSVGWASFPLTDWQMRLLATVFEDAVFSLTDFRLSPGEFLCFPKIGKGESAKREPKVWHRGDFNLLSKSELRDTLDCYLAALAEAKAIMAAEDARAEQQPAEEKPIAEAPLLEWATKQV